MITVVKCYFKCCFVALSAAVSLLLHVTKRGIVVYVKKKKTVIMYCMKLSFTLDALEIQNSHS